MSTTENVSVSTCSIHFDGLCNYLHLFQKQPAANFLKNNSCFLGPGLVKANLGPGPVNANSEPEPVNTNWGPGPKHKLGARFGGQAKNQGPGNTNTIFFIKETIDQIRFAFLSKRTCTNIDLKEN